MPHYEPVARKPFITPPASRTTSRKNSMHDATRPTLSQENEPEVPPLPELLAETIKKLKDTRDGDGERGRRREPRRPSLGVADKAEPLWEDGSRVGRRERSVSTRDKVAIWEERSRSRSMGRSKSRRRHLDDGNRVSIVPEVPDLELAIAQAQAHMQAGGPSARLNKAEKPREAESLSLVSSDPPTHELVQSDVQAESQEQHDSSEIEVVSTPPAASDAHSQQDEDITVSQEPLEQPPALESEQQGVDRPAVRSPPVEESPLQQSLDKQSPIQEILAEKAPVDQLPITSAEELSIGDTPIRDSPVEELEEILGAEIPVEDLQVEVPVEQVPFEEVSAEEGAIRDVQFEELQERPVEELPVAGLHVEEIPVKDLPAEELPIDVLPVEELFIEELPIEESPIEELPVEGLPMKDLQAEETVEHLPVKDLPAEHLPVEESPIEDFQTEDQQIKENPEENIPLQEVSVEETPSDTLPVETLQLGEIPAEETEKTPAHEFSMEKTPAQQILVEDTSVDGVAKEPPVESFSVEETPAQQIPVEDTPVEGVFEEPLVEKSPIDETLVHESPPEGLGIEESHVDDLALNDPPLEQIPAGETLAAETPIKELSTDKSAPENPLVEELLREDIMAERLPMEEISVSPEDGPLQQDLDSSIETAIPSEPLNLGSEIGNEKDDKEESGLHSAASVVDDHLEASIEATEMYRSSGPMDSADLVIAEINPVSFSPSIEGQQSGYIPDVEESHIESPTQSLHVEDTHIQPTPESSNLQAQDMEQKYETGQETQVYALEASELGSFEQRKQEHLESTVKDNHPDDISLNTQDMTEDTESFDGSRVVPAVESQPPVYPDSTVEHSAPVTWEEVPSALATGEVPVLSSEDDMQPPTPNREAVDGAATPEDIVKFQVPEGVSALEENIDVEDVESPPVLEPVLEPSVQDLSKDEEETVPETAPERDNSHQDFPLSSATSDADIPQHDPEVTMPSVIWLGVGTVMQSSGETTLEPVTSQPEPTEVRIHEAEESLDQPIRSADEAPMSPGAFRSPSDDEPQELAEEDPTDVLPSKPALEPLPQENMASFEVETAASDVESLEAQSDSESPEVLFQDMVMEDISSPADKITPSEQPESEAVPTNVIDIPDDVGDVAAMESQQLVEQTLETREPDGFVSDVSLDETSDSMLEQLVVEQLPLHEQNVLENMAPPTLEEMGVTQDVNEPDASSTFSTVIEHSDADLVATEPSTSTPTTVRERRIHDDVNSQLASPTSSADFHSALATPADAVFPDAHADIESVASEGHSEDSVRTDRPSSGLSNAESLASDHFSELSDNLGPDEREISPQDDAESAAPGAPNGEDKIAFSDLAGQNPAKPDMEVDSLSLLQSNASEHPEAAEVLTDSTVGDQVSLRTEGNHEEATLAITDSIVSTEPETSALLDVDQGVLDTDVADTESVAEEEVSDQPDNTSRSLAEPTATADAEVNEQRLSLDSSLQLAEFSVNEDESVAEISEQEQHLGNGDDATEAVVESSKHQDNAEFDAEHKDDDTESEHHEVAAAVERSEPAISNSQSPKALQAEVLDMSVASDHDALAAPPLEIDNNTELMTPERFNRDSGVQMTQEEDSDSEQPSEELGLSSSDSDEKLAVDRGPDRLSAEASDDRTDLQVVRDSGVGLIDDASHVTTEQVLESKVQLEQSLGDITIDHSIESAESPDELSLNGFDDDAASIHDIAEDQLPTSPRPSTPVQPERRLLNNLPTPEATPDRTQRPSETSVPAKTLLDTTADRESEHGQLKNTNREIAVEALERPSTPPSKALHSTEFPPTPSSAPRETTKARNLEGSNTRSKPQDYLSRQKSSLSSIEPSDTHVAVAMAEEVLGDFASEPPPLSAKVPLESELEPERGRRRTRDWAQNPPQLSIEAEVAKQETFEQPPALPPRKNTSKSKKPNRDMQGYRVPSDDVSDVPPPSGPPPSSRSVSRPPAYQKQDGMQMPALPPRTQQLSANAAPYQPRETPKNYPAPPQGVAGPSGFNIPPPPEPAYTNGRTSRAPSKSRSKSRRRLGGLRNLSRPRRQPWDAPPVVERAIHAAAVGVMQGFSAPMGLYRDLRDFYYPPPGRPDVVKAYEVRGRLPIRIFFPSHHDSFSQALLPTLFTIHGGAFTIGNASDDDVWNRNFADSYSTLVIALNYAKAPWAGFPCPLLDVEALYHAAINDESLPIDKSRMALAGFDAGANLALSLAQLPSVRNGVNPNGAPYPYPQHLPYPPPRAAISICGLLDFAIPSGVKARTRPYKRQLRGIRGWGPGLDWMVRILPSSSWSYIPYGHDAMDPLLSPMYARRADLPPHLFVIGAELDCLAHDSWRAACTWAGRPVPASSILVGRRNPSRWRGALDDGAGENAMKFAWEERGNGTGGEGSTRWLLVPDVVHGFDCEGWRTQYMWADEEGRADSEMKTFAYQRELALWLWGTVWRDARPWR